MNPITVGILGSGLLVFLLFLGMPIAFVMMFVGFLGISVLASAGAALPVVAKTVYETAAHYPYTIIPLFILMGDQGIAHTASGTLQKIDNTPGEINLLGNFKNPGNRHGAEAACLDNGRVPGSKGPDVIEGDHSRKIEGRKKNKRSKGLPDIQSINTCAHILCMAPFHQLRPSAGMLNIFHGPGDFSSGIR